MAAPGLKRQSGSRITCFLFSRRAERGKADNYYKKRIIKHSEDLLVYQTMLMKIKLLPIIKMVSFM
jgi:hypothetical protein